MSTETFLYVITKGWKSGQPHEIEIWYVEHGDSYYIVAEHPERAHWVQNIQRDPAVEVRLGKNGTWRPARARLISPAAEPELAAEISRLMDAKYQWSDGLIAEIHPLTDEI
jgi:deazaflavin-dependent oxidoreductase (nitroreductase family)